MLTNRIVLQRHRKPRRAEAHLRLLRREQDRDEFRQALELRLYIQEEPHLFGDYAIVAEFDPESHNVSYVVAMLLTAAYV